MEFTENITNGIKFNQRLPKLLTNYIKDYYQRYPFI